LFSSIFGAPPRSPCSTWINVHIQPQQEHPGAIFTHRKDTDTGNEFAASDEVGRFVYAGGRRDRRSTKAGDGRATKAGEGRTTKTGEGRATKAGVGANKAGRRKPTRAGGKKKSDPSNERSRQSHMSRRSRRTSLSRQKARNNSSKGAEREAHNK
jgi:hypothetical protein